MPEPITPTPLARVTGNSVASIIFENSTTCYLNGVQKTVLYPGKDLSASLFRTASSDTNKDLVIVSNNNPKLQIFVHGYSWGHGCLDTNAPFYEPMLMWFNTHDSTSGASDTGISLITPRYIGDMDRTTPLEILLPPGKNLCLSFVEFPSSPPTTTLLGALTVTYEIRLKEEGSSTFTNTYIA